VRNGGVLAASGICPAVGECRDHAVGADLGRRDGIATDCRRSRSGVRTARMPRSCRRNGTDADHVERAEAAKTYLTSSGRADNAR
jgi:hypothetical protein